MTPKQTQSLLFDEEQFLQTPEIGDENEDDLQVDFLNKLSEAVTWSTDWTVESIVSQLNKNIIDIDPKFQRRDAWSEIKKSRFIESLIYSLPIPQIVLAEHKTQKGTYIVVDGKQRLLTLKQFLTESPDTNVFHKLSGLRNKKLNNKTFSDLQKDHSPFYNSFVNQSIRSIIIKNWPSETFLYTIFYRLNTGSLSLSPQELRRALKKGPFIDFVDDLSVSSKKIQGLFNINKPDFRMRDLDLVIRYYAVINRIEQYKGSYKSFLDETCDFFNSNWGKKSKDAELQSKHMDDLIDFVNKMFDKKHAFRRWRNGKYEPRFNKAIFDIFIYYLNNPAIRSEVEKFPKKFISAYQTLCEKNEKFVKSVSSNTNNLIETSTRFVLFGKALKKALNIPFKIPKNLQDYFNAKQL